MRILKYIFLLILLSLVASSIFVATQKGEFTVEKSKVIHSPKATIYNYVNDAKNWKEWNSLAVKNSSINIDYSQNTVGKGSFFSWEGKNGIGNLQTISLKENNNISQKINLDGNSAEISMNFKDTLAGTKVTWKAKGEMGFLFKVMTLFDGGAKKVFTLMFEKSLVNLSKKLDYEINTFAVKVDGVVNRPEIFYLSQTYNCEFSKVNKNAQIVFPKITAFCKNNNIMMSGKPFVIYHIYDTVKKLTRLSFCVPIRDSIYTSEGSDILSKKLPAFQAVKTTLVGDYSHNKKALDKAAEYFQTKQFVPEPTFSHLEIFTIGKAEIQNPSKWTTEIYYPIKQKDIPPAPVIPAKPKPLAPPIEEDKTEY